MTTATLRNAWTGLCRFLKDDSYERYLEEHARERPEEPPLDREAFRKVYVLGMLGRMCCDG